MKLINAGARCRYPKLTGAESLSGPSWLTVACELQRDWRLPTGQDLGRVFHDHYHSYGLLMDSFDSKTANVARKAS